MNVVGLENAAEVGFVRGSGAEPPNRRLFVPECFKEGKWKTLRIERLVSELRDGFFYFNGIQLFIPSPAPSNSRRSLRWHQTPGGASRSFGNGLKAKPFMRIRMCTSKDKRCPSQAAGLRGK